MSRRIYLWSAVLAAIGAVAAFALGGRDYLAGFLAGAAFSVLNFRFLHNVVDSLGTERPHRASAVFMSIRLLLLGLLIYVILEYSSSSLPAALCGLFVAVTAAILEALYQALYARTP